MLNDISDKTVPAHPVWGCVLIGGQSRRMGTPKHLIADGQGITWLERTIAIFRRHVEHVVVAGRGELPATLAGIERVVDAPEVDGPLAGVLGTMRSFPGISWIVSACDMPLLDDAGLQWLLAQRRPEVWGVVPKQQDGRLEPLFAYYDFRSRFLLEKLCLENELRMTRICDSERIVSPVVPAALAFSWRNCNTPDDVKAISQHSPESPDAG